MVKYIKKEGSRLYHCPPYLFLFALPASTFQILLHRYTDRKGVVTCILDGPRFPPFKEMISLPRSSFSRLFCPISTRCTSLSLDTFSPSYRPLFPCQFPRGRATSVFHQLGTGSISTITPLRQSFLTHAASKRNNTGLAVFSTFLFCARLLLPNRNLSPQVPSRPSAHLNSRELENSKHPSAHLIRHLLPFTGAPVCP